MSSSWLYLVISVCALIVLCSGQNAQKDTCQSPPLPKADTKPFQEIYQWRMINFNWQTPSDQDQALQDQTYIPKNVAISGIKLWKKQIYFSVSRLKEGSPVTLATVPKNRVDPTRSPVFDAFPDWAMQEIGNCRALQFVQSMEIDTEGRMWIIDTGIVHLYGVKPMPKCPPKLVIINLDSVKQIGCRKSKKNDCPEDNYEIVHTYEFPNSVVSRQTNFLNDIVVDSTDGYYAYITDFGEPAGIVVYSLKKNKSWKISDDNSMRPKPNAGISNINGVDVSLNGKNVNGIALSPVTDENRVVYYMPMGGHDLYSIPASVLKNKTNARNDVSSTIKDLGEKQSISDGMVCDSKGNIYYGLQGCNMVATWNPTWGNFKESQKMLEQNNVKLLWPASFAIDDETGELYVTTNRLAHLIFGQINLGEINYSVLRTTISAKSYKVPS